MRDEVLEPMIDVLGTVVEDGRRAKENNDVLEDWSPEIIAISGDIAFTGSAADYEVASDYLRRLLERLGLEPTRVVMCPGNHDRLILGAGSIDYPETSADCDRLLDPDELREATAAGTAAIVTPFSEFVKFCDALGVNRPAGLEGLEYLTGRCACDLPDRGARVEFVVVNSAWFAKPGNSDARNMWLGLPLIRVLTANQDPADADQDINLVRVGLCHHTREWLHEEEHDSYSERANTYKTFARECDVLLHGHVHGALEAPGRPYNEAQAFTGGASYAGQRFRNNFSLLQLNLVDHSIRRRGFEYDPREGVWQELDHAEGTYALTLRDRLQRADSSVEDLAGVWHSVFWQEELASARAPRDAVQIVRDEDERHGVWFKSVDWSDAQPLDENEVDGERRVSLKGKLEHGFFTGLWKDAQSVKRDGTGGRFGAFQVRVNEGGGELVGRWVGFDVDHKVRYGRWRLERGEAGR